MPAVTIQNLTSGPFAVPPPVARVLRAGASVTVTLSEAEATDPALLQAASAGAISLSAAPSASVPDALESMSIANVRDITLSAAAEVANARVVSGQIVNGGGAAVEAAAEVLVEVFAPTVAKGAITVTGGTSKVNIAPGSTNISRCWLTTTATGSFAVSIADDVAETVLVKVTADNGACSLLALAFAA